MASVGEDTLTRVSTDGMSSAPKHSLRSILITHRSRDGTRTVVLQGSPVLKTDPRKLLLAHHLEDYI